MQRRWNCPKNEPTRWASQDWDRAWQSALRRINGMPPALVTNELVQQAVSTMDEAFKQGDSNMFEVALIALLDECADLVNRGDYQQWW
jgi:hypothetical protein